MRSLQNTAADKRFFCNAYLRLRTLTLSGQNRIALVGEDIGGDLQHPANNLGILFSDDVKRKEVRRIIHDAFDSYLVIDPTNLGQLRFRLSSREPVNDTEERGLHQEAVQFHAAASPIELASDGVKAFAGIITAIIAGDPEVITIDEPEAFLRPSLSFNLGKEIGRATGSEKRVLVSTHSADFVMGCIQSGAPLNIVRLTYQEGTATARILSSENILRLMRNPLLRSTGVLNGLFYKFVIVTEADPTALSTKKSTKGYGFSSPNWEFRIASLYTRKIGKLYRQLFAPFGKWVSLQRESSISTFLKRAVPYGVIS